jgi:uncharacterized membrane protein YfcA
MSILAAVFVLVMAFVTSVMSGVFGMAGGLVLMGGLTLILPVSAAFVAQGLIQLVANGWRAILHRQHLRWRIVLIYAAASLAAGVLVSLIAFRPSKPLVYLLLGVVPAILWLPKGVLRLDAARAPDALACGFLVTALNLTAGVAGPLLDIFFVRTALTRHQIVATKAATQVLSHLSKVVVYGAPLIAARALPASFFWPIALSIPLSMLGTVVGGRVLERLTDRSFIRWTRYIITAVGAAFLVEFAMLMVGRGG